MKIAVFGANGRVGSAVVRIAQQRGHSVLPIDKAQGSTGVAAQNAAIEPKLGENESKIDVVVDFSAANATAEVCEFCRAHRCPLVTGVTGRNEEQQATLDGLAKELPVVAKANFCEGVATLIQLVKQAANALPDWDCEIVEIHRRAKKDAPSGTAITLAAVGSQRKNFSNVTVHSLRCGSNFGRHTVIFAADGESLTLTHQAENADIFAKGALKRAESLFAAQNIPDGKGVGTVDGE